MSRRYPTDERGVSHPDPAAALAGSRPIHGIALFRRCALARSVLRGAIRRTALLLRAVVWCTAAVGGGALLADPTIAATPERDPARLRILGPDYPRVFYFRAAESACNRRRYPTYKSWENDFAGLMGIMGKCLDEECVGRMPRNPEFFTRFKLRHPEQAVLLHFNGNARDPRFETEGYFPGHWIYRRAVWITEDVPAESGITTIHVSDTRAFRVNTGRYRKDNDDVALFRVRDGRHDWYHCEQVQLLRIDHDAGTITVKRGCYGTRPLAFRKGEARAAAHAVEGPWGRGNHLLWLYNFATDCPRDRQGRTAADVLVEDLARWFGPDGPLAAFDGVEFDVLHNTTFGDTDGDGIEDRGVRNGRNVYGAGVIEFCRSLRKRMGKKFLIMADGALGWGGLKSQRACRILNGIESEGWPNLNDWEFRDWSGGLNRHGYWQSNAFPPPFSYFNHKWSEPVPGRPGGTRTVRVPYSRHRLVFAAAQFCDAMLCYSTPPLPPPATGCTFWSRDVRIPRGAVLRFAVGMGQKSPELSDGVVFQVFLAELRNGRPEPFRKLWEFQTRAFRWHPAKIDLGQYAGKTVRLRFLADCGPADDATTDHAWWGDVRIESSGEVIRLVTPRLPPTGMRIRGKQEQPLDRRTGALLKYDPEADLAGQRMPAYFVHPPYRPLRRPEHYPVWDEFVCGADRRPGWLGKPLGNAVHLAERTPDLLHGSGRGHALAARIRGEVTVEVRGDNVVDVAPRQAPDPGREHYHFTLPDIPVRGEDVCVSLVLSGLPGRDMPPEAPRYAVVTLSGGMIDLVADGPDQMGMCLRGGTEVPIAPDSGAVVRFGKLTVGGKTLPGVFVHPPWKKGTGYTFWCRDVIVPADSDLRFSIGMGEKSPERSDGVWFRVYAAVLNNGRPGRFVKLFERSWKQYEWHPELVPLDMFAGKPVRFKFVADAGPADNSTTDHAHWGQVRIVCRDVAPSGVTEAQRIMTWFGPEPFRARFYFRPVRSDRVTLTIRVEGRRPLRIHSLAVYAHPDAVWRLFENGLVLANPGLRPYTFDLSAISPGRRYRRLRGTEFQDPETNNGQPVSGSVRLGPLDALFLVRVP